MSSVNVSSKEKTIKSMYQILQNENYTLDKFIYYCEYGNNTAVELGNILDNYRSYFEKFLVTATLPEKFYYQPAAFAENYYGTPDLDFLVMYFSKIYTILDFNIPEIKVLPKDKILEVNRIIVKHKKEVDKSY